MNEPVEEVSTVIRLLTQSVPSLQQRAIDRFFTQDAAFSHPFCRVPSFAGSRWYVLKIFQWYKVMSPRIELQIHSIAFDEVNLKLYIQMGQIFSIWLVPFHVAPVSLTTVLDLVGDSSQDGTVYYIKKQEDLYQTSEFIKFLLPHVGHWLVCTWHLIASLFCVLGVFLLYPMLWLEENGYLPARIAQGNLAYPLEEKIWEIKKE